MKKIKLNVYFLVVFFMTITYSFAQSNYLPLLNINNQWNILRRGANPYINYTEIFKIDKDTIINEKSCKRIMKSTDSSSNAIYNFAYYMYEDTITKYIHLIIILIKNYILILVQMQVIHWFCIVRTII